MIHDNNTSPMTTDQDPVIVHDDTWELLGWIFFLFSFAIAVRLIQFQPSTGISSLGWGLPVLLALLGGISLQINHRNFKRRT